MSSADAASQAGAGLPDDGQPENPLDVIGRLAALIMVQVDYVQQMMDGTNEPTDPTGEADPGAGGGSESNPSVSDAEAAAKAVTTGNLAKVDTASEEVLQKVLKEHGLDLGALKKMADSNSLCRSCSPRPSRRRRLLSAPVSARKMKTLLC
jgi:hypothetical protein